MRQRFSFVLGSAAVALAAATAAFARPLGGHGDGPSTVALAALGGP